MQLTPEVVVLVVVVAVATFVLFRWGRRHEAPALTDAPRIPARSTPMVARADRDTQRLVDWLIDRAVEQTGISVGDDALVRDRLGQAAAKAMEELAVNGSAAISLPFLTADARGPRHFAVEFKRNPDSTFEQTG
jgi:hypothetical protein